ncbi:tRNA1(Val) (adenine(37)-N6)-methyltransferase [Kaistella jeonii]|uniref:tRNA1(Val) (adenine(37)-N6)-methyltransferase n=1 Tax=Kaistella jeonii TaxID=266749 RepID=A0A0C1F950_9FLAO|nr:methyltransferase [Kaistella jeonii]KIA89657.1 tRNA (adenine-N6)-methyltransferase [Kaistella jeonii]SFB89054.1 tRNA1Val (adenine37-N6)-methyltransferase [Kaistella jeonii]VEI95875.1 tRNA1(Val) (adenine(37)-N6)-methyltransferase [Kaistella jeonii]
MKPFLFKNFSINQSKKVFRVGTDGVLLGALSSVENVQTILEVGTGTGLVSLMLTQRNLTARILALDINEEAKNIADENFRNSPFGERLSIELQDFKDFKTQQRFDLIISNPPYFKENSSDKDILARQQTELSFENLIEKSAEILSEKGRLAVIIPFESGADFEELSLNNKLFLSRKIQIFGIKNSAPKRWILEFGFDQREISEEQFTIERSPRVYSEQYLELTKDFHLFQK